MPGHVDQRVALVDDGRTPPGQPVDDAEDRVSLPGMSDLASTTVSPGSILTGWSRFAIRDSADSGSPCEPVEMSTTCSGGQASISRASTMRSAGTAQVAEVARDPHVAHHRPADEGDLSAVRLSDVEHLLDPVHVARRSRRR